MTSLCSDALPGTRGRWLLLGLSSLFAVYLVLLVAEPAGTSDVVRWLYNILLVGAAFVCLTSPNQRGRERAAWRCLGTTLLLWAAGDFYYTLFLLDSTVAPPTVTDWLWLVSYPVLYAGIGLLVRARTRALRAEPLARCGARRARGRRCRSRGPVRRGRREHRRLASDRGDERGVSACRRAAARHGRRRPGDHRLAARPRLAVHPRQHGRAHACGQRRPLPGGASARRTASRCSMPAGRSRCSSSPPPPGSRQAGSAPSAPRAHGCSRCRRSSA